MDTLNLLLIAITFIVVSFSIFSIIKSKKNKETINVLSPSINEFITELELLSKNYLANSQLIYLKEKYHPLYEQILTLPRNIIKKQHDFSYFLTFYKDFDQKVENSNIHFINHELKEAALFFQNIDGKSLDRQQQEAVVVDEDNTLVLAGAGSGKTLTISAKVKYLTERLGIHPDEILLISFTSKSASEMTERIQGKLNIPVEAKTFHKLGLQIITSSNKSRPDIQNELSKVINKYFKEHVLTNLTLMSDIIHFYGFYLSVPKDLEEFNTLGEYIDDQATVNLETLRSKLTYQQSELSRERKTLKLEEVKSLEEVLIANFLYLNGVEYEYEKLYPIASDKYRKRYRPDFYLPNYNIYLEHFGITADETAPWLSPIEERKYIEDMNWKRSWHKINETKLIESYSYYNKNGELLDKIRILLLENGVVLKPINLTEAYKNLFIKRNEERQFKEFKGLISTFITLFKSNGYDDSDFIKMKEKVQVMNNPFHRERTRLFLTMVQPIYNNYQHFLINHHSIDFNDMINNAINIVNNSEDQLFGYKYIIIDEYQDISTNRFRLIKAIKDMTNAKVMCVGDDWQSIFRFAGSDLELFLNFEKYFGFSKLLRIEKTYRNSQQLIDIAGRFVMENDKQFSKKLTSFRSLDNPIRIYGYDKNAEKAFSFAVDEIVNKMGEETTIMVIGRNRLDIKFLLSESKEFHYAETSNEIFSANKNHSNLQFLYTTVHSSKGLEADNVILINLTNHLVGFPNKISDDPLLSLVLNDTDQFEYAEERRLFYVALTRTKNTVYLITPQEQMSIFVEELIKKHKIEFNLVTGETSLRENPRCPVCKEGKMVVRESNFDNKRFLGCSNYPKCSQVFKDLSILTNPVVCTTCNGFMTIRKGPKGEFYGCTNFPVCRNSFDNV
ncbi:UvrD-helicase domain-containing protein [Sporosarcina sp. CAU 1771]